MGFEFLRKCVRHLLCHRRSRIQLIAQHVRCTNSILKSEENVKEHSRYPTFVQSTRRYLIRKSYSFTLFSSFIVALARMVGVVDTDGMGVDAAVFLFRLLVVLLILSDPGLLGGDSLTVGPIMFAGPAPLMLLKCPTVAGAGP